ncbi:DUF2787 domain-containing protein [Vibrio sp. V27_P1S3P104]|uniref:DUF2787 family protein n=1 Tax=unclassified Vibrio TaxID=2614977 RepID=UPI00137367B3|nr:MULTISPECIES: DUF2787 family protein [unclassified Vibrio]NAX34110.1 DUF2787 domain-containing protein [Vibrio sp. V29_P1S30P107]NAX35991.1 DUF2787 domain-containing protein [Vibrio sp. V27_P1S3P104]
MLNHKQNLPFSVTSKLSEFLAQRINKDGLSIINFRNSKYHAEAGGFRPVEVMIEKSGESYAIIYYTEFRYFGQGIYAELGKSNDFDFRELTYYAEFIGPVPFDEEVGEMFNLFVSNTLSYAEMGCFDEIKVSYLGGHILLGNN